MPYYSLLPATSSSSIVNSYNPSAQTATTLILSLLDAYIINEFLDCEQSRALYVCLKYVPTGLIMTRLLSALNMSNGIYETRRGMYFLLGISLFRRRASTRALFQQTIPYLINVKSNEFMLEPNVYLMCLALNVLLLLEFNTNEDPLEEIFRVKSWKKLYQSGEPMVFDTIDEHTDDILPKYEDRSVTDAYHEFFDWSSKELFLSDNVRPVNYFLGWLQTILWMFSRTAKLFKPFIKPKLVGRR